MAPRPTAERPPKGLNAEWTHVFQCALDTLKAQDSWSWELKPLLDEYIYALRAAQQCRDGFAWLDSMLGDLDGREWDDVQSLTKLAAGLPTMWDRHTKRAQALADQLALTPRGRKAIGVRADGDDKQPADPFQEADELAERRIKRA